MSILRRSRRRTVAEHQGGVGGAAAIAGGIGVACSLPPIGLWPLGILGFSLLALSLRAKGLGSRFAYGWLFGVGQFAIGLFWAKHFTLVGYLLLIAIEACFMAIAAALVRRSGALVSFAGALVLGEWARQHFPLGGLPIAGAALGQAAGPLAPTARLGGPLAVVGVTALFGALIAECILAGACHLGARPQRAMPLRMGGLGVGALIAVAVAVIGVYAPNGGAPVRVIDAVAVQGGGQLGLDQTEVASTTVFRRVFQPTAALVGPVDLVVWPEDSVELARPPRDSSIARAVGALAERLHTTLLAGMTVTVGSRRFLNEIVAYGPRGTIVAEFEKVHAVPFGEYVPARGLLAHFVNLDAVPRDVIIGHANGAISTPAGRFALVVSFEDFFALRGRSGVRAGGEALIVPTNTASYASNEMPAQELAASRLQAISEGRDLLQVSETGYSALVSNDGTVLSKSALGHPAVLHVGLALRKGATDFDRFGETPLIALSALALVLFWVKERRATRDGLQTAGRKFRRFHSG